MRAQVRARGARMMTALLAGFPEVEVLAYATLFPGTWEDAVQLEVNGIEGRAAPDGPRRPLGRDDQRGGVRRRPIPRRHLLQNAAHKGGLVGCGVLLGVQPARQRSVPQVLELVLCFEPRVRLTVPLDQRGHHGLRTCQRTRVRRPSSSSAFSRWGMGGEFANFAYNGVEFFDYTPYEEAMRRFSSPQRDRPRRTTSASRRQQHPVVTQGSNGATAALSGAATDDLAIWVVRWSNDRGGNGTAEMEWEPGEGGSRQGLATGRMLWRIEDIPLQPGPNVLTVTAQGIKGTTSSASCP